ncbi:Nucleolar protein 10, partial [Sciurus carolinensis]|nr:Nucleolar protein 10 [Sciurus carolinensis]
VDVRRRIELIQDFEMPTVCTTIKVSKDGQYILATGTYKPRVRCYDTYQLSLKFERCLDSEDTKSYNLQITHDQFFSLIIKGNQLVEQYLNSIKKGIRINSLPTISALKFNGALTMAVGTSTGQVLLYDLRSDKPLLVKDHQYGLPIKSVHFQESLDLILSSDSRIIKMWNKNSGKIFTSLEPEHDLNDVCLYPNSGMLFTANETPKMGIYYIPVLGPAPRWCSFLDNLTEELEENPESTVYDDYKFVTKKDLENLGLTHLIGSPFLRAYMHGFFMDIRLYHKVKLMVNPFAYEEYRKDKIRQKIEETRAQRVQLKKLPKVNKELALKLIEEEEEKQKSTWKKKVKNLPSILTDDRFKVMFENPDFQVDEESEEFRLLNPLVSKISEKRKKKLRLLEEQELREKEEEEEPEGKPSDAESSESSDDEKDWVEEVRRQRRLLRQEGKTTRQQVQEDQQTVLQPQFYEIKAGEEFRSFRDSATKQKLMNKTLEDRLKLEAKSGTLNVSDTTVGSKQLTFTLKRSEQQKKQQEAEKLHRQERKKLRRSAGHLRSRPQRGRPWH